MVKIKTVIVCDNNADATLFDDLHNKVNQLSGGKFGIEVVGFIQKSLTAPHTQTFSQDSAVLVAKEVSALYPAAQWLVMFHHSDMVRSWAYTNLFENALKYPFTVMPIEFGDRTSRVGGLFFELGHALIMFYNFYRDRATMPSISNVDNYDGGDQIVVEKFNQLTPYLSVFEGNPKPSVVEKDMLRLIKMKDDGNAATTKDNTVWLVNDQTMTRLWILDPATRDSFGLPVVEGDPSKYKYSGAIGRFSPDDPFK